MRRRHRTLRELVALLRFTPEEAQDARAEQCMEALFDAERCECHDLGVREEAGIEAERRRWTQPQTSNTNITLSSTGL
jgi:hypothetical protein